MAAMYKLFAGLVVIFCLVQFIEMARVARDVSATPDAGNDLSDVLKDLLAKAGEGAQKLTTDLKSALDKAPEQGKKLVESPEFKDIQNLIQNGANEAIEKLKQLANTLASNSAGTPAN